MNKKPEPSEGKRIIEYVDPEGNIGHPFVCMRCGKECEADEGWEYLHIPRRKIKNINSVWKKYLDYELCSECNTKMFIAMDEFILDYAKEYSPHYYKEIDKDAPLTQGELDMQLGMALINEFAEYEKRMNKK